ncbi:hypothetical protein HanXRQr2_Chr12g0547651 [Helianthus annuus]|uniref:Uncharacterized protein n=1 Tax=Helianthus annuus TaxID=4232 RepID=A0A9K3HHM9_HELAN|nr:hypothetical protein HanXRQr2_Chr12g0547631 [Helianthus annuus]KAF5778453.1 hypothetical protein HanXRQr2_Chr12g0547651 [Helianthus annuus]KAJ0863196.1 hypothetical protein HanPSC8_Chr12g0527121 [Helianthus annuus]
MQAIIRYKKSTNSLSHNCYIGKKYTYNSSGDRLPRCRCDVIVKTLTKDKYEWKKIYLETIEK